MEPLTGGTQDPGPAPQATADHPQKADLSWKRFELRYLEITVVLLVGMVVLSMLLGVLRGAAGIEYPASWLPAIASIEMGVVMTVIMIGWLRVRRYGWATALEMSATMLAPALLAALLTQIGVVGIGVAMPVEHVLMFLLMLAIMVRRRDEFMTRRLARA